MRESVSIWVQEDEEEVDFLFDGVSCGIKR